VVPGSGNCSCGRFLGQGDGRLLFGDGLADWLVAGLTRKTHWRPAIRSHAAKAWTLGAELCSTMAAVYPAIMESGADRACWQSFGLRAAVLVIELGPGLARYLDLSTSSAQPSVSSCSGTDLPGRATLSHADERSSVIPPGVLTARHDIRRPYGFDRAASGCQSCCSQWPCRARFEAPKTYAG